MAEFPLLASAQLLFWARLLHSLVLVASFANGLPWVAQGGAAILVAAHYRWLRHRLFPRAVAIRFASAQGWQLVYPKAVVAVRILPDSVLSVALLLLRMETILPESDTQRRRWWPQSKLALLLMPDSLPAGDFYRLLAKLKIQENISNKL